MTQHVLVCFSFLRRHAGIAVLLLLFAGLVFAWTVLLTMP